MIAKYTAEDLARAMRVGGTSPPRYGVERRAGVWWITINGNCYGVIPRSMGAPTAEEAIQRAMAFLAPELDAIEAEREKAPADAQAALAEGDPIAEQWAEKHAPAPTKQSDVDFLRGVADVLDVATGLRLTSNRVRDIAGRLEHLLHDLDVCSGMLHTSNVERDEALAECRRLQENKE